MAFKDFHKLPSDKHVTVRMAPGGPAPLGAASVFEPTAAVLNGGAGSGFLNVSPSISWSDYSLTTEASETTNEPSLADSASYEEFGQSNFGGSVSFFVPADYDDNSNMHSLAYDLTDQPGARVDAMVRIDGAVETDAPIADNDFVSVYRLEVGGEVNPFTPGESKRRTVSFVPKNAFSHYTVAGEHVLTPIVPSSFEVGDKGRIRVSVQGRDYTNALEFSTSDGGVIDVRAGGFFVVRGEGSATVTIFDRGANVTETVSVTVGD